MFVLPFDIPDLSQKIRLKESLFSMGSCFSDEIGTKLSAYKFNVVSNPLGIIYNPFSIFKNIRLLLSEGLDPDNYMVDGDVYYHWDTHSSISGTNKSSFHKLLDEKAHQSKLGLANADWIILTFGTIYVYKYLPSGKIVANCHKVPQKKFQKIALSDQEIIEDYFQTLDVLRSVKKDIKVILTVSPVRHVRDGLIENNISKATLLKAVHEIVEKDERTHYFPSYELMIDVLRDYRFYKEDMIHPSAQAVDYIWDRFTEACIDLEGQNFIRQWDKIKKSLAHRPFHPTSSEHQTFLKKTLTKLTSLEEKVDVTSEIAQLKKQLIS